MGCLKIAPIFIGCGGRNGREGLLYNEGLALIDQGRPLVSVIAGNDVDGENRE